MDLFQSPSREGQCRHLLHPPALSSIVENDDILQPSQHQLDDALEKSRKYWYHLASLAYAHRDHGLAPEYINPRHTLRRVPKLQGRPKTFYSLHIGVSPSQALCLQASSTWRLMGKSDCDKVEKEMTNPAILQIGTRVAIPYNFKGNAFCRWVGTTEEKATSPNYLAILTIGWCYILSARLVEIQGEGAAMRYTSSEAEHYHEGVCYYPTTIIDIGEADKSVVRWWSAILAQREGWKAVIRQSTDGEFLAPWTVSRTCETSFAVKPMRESASSVSVYTPLSSDRAFEALAHFALLHGLGSQLPVALATAMTFPTHNYHGSTVQLPFPTTTGAKKSTTPLDSIPSTWVNLSEELPYYMTLSCCPEMMISIFCGSFWELEVPCNLVSPWLHPVLNEVLVGASPMHMTGSDQEILAFIGAMRQPNISAIWLGAVISGLGPIVLQRVRRGRSPLDSLAFPWTGCPQSFMDFAGSGPYTCESPERISRPDVWRLLHLPPTEEDDLSYRYRPRTPWAPCGKTKRENCALRVVSHLNCSRHQFQYDHWNWELEDGALVRDDGFSKQPLSTFLDDVLDAENPKEFPKIELNQEASREASLDIFRWFVINGEGLPSESIYQDEWLKDLGEEVDSEEVDGEEEDGEEEDDEEPDIQDSQRSVRQTGDRFETWLSTIT